MDMVVCSFIGNSDVCDYNLYPRLREVTKSIAEENGRVDFMILPQYAELFAGSFSDFCLRAALETKSHYPQKVTITLICHDENEKKKFEMQADGSIPACMVDRILIPNIAASSKSGAYSKRVPDVQRWIIQHSTYVVSSLYEIFHAQENHLLYFARRMDGLKIIDISSEEIALAIKEKVKDLTDREQLALKSLEDGHTLEETGTALGVGRERARSIARKAGLQLEKHARRYSNKMRAQSEYQIKCAVFSLGDATYSNLKAFRHIVDYLITKYRVKQFYIQGDYGCSGFMTAFDQNKSIYNFHTTAVITASEHNEDTGDLIARYCPPCDRVENVDTTFAKAGTDAFAALTAMMDQADFCICNLSASPMAEEIRAYITQTKYAALLDISKKA